MALSIQPKSEIRQVKSITHGFGEIPIAVKNGQQGWALPGKVITFSPLAALNAAKRLDAVIRANTKPTKQARFY